MTLISLVQVNRSNARRGAVCHNCSVPLAVIVAIVSKPLGSEVARPLRSSFSPRSQPLFSFHSFKFHTAISDLLPSLTTFHILLRLSLTLCLLFTSSTKRQSSGLTTERIPYLVGIDVHS